MSQRIASVIVDVSAHPVDRAFDYLIPQQFETLIEVGCRVKVPFGPRAVLGFVVEIKNDSQFDLNKLKPIAELMDIEPVLNEELMQLANWLKRETICFEIDALQVMLPSALRAKYEKIAHLKVPKEELSDQLLAYFPKNSDKVNVKQFEKNNDLQLLKLALQQGIIEIENSVKQQGVIKQVRKVQIEQDVKKLEAILAQLSNSSKKQRHAIEWMIMHAGEVFEPDFLMKEAGISQAVLKTVIEKGAAQFVHEETYRDPFTKAVEKTNNLKLTDEQHAAMEKILQAMQQKKPETFLLHGITGSGKTEIYLQAIEQAIAEGKEAIVLVPEISLTPQMNERFRSRFGEKVAVMHSGLSVGEKYDEWRKIQQKKVQVVVGARSAIFAPFTNVGLIILDEEHESTYKQDDSPRYHARDVAIWRSNYYNCPVILGSATPSLESFARARKGVYTLLQLKERAKKQALPEVQIVDMRRELQSGNRSMFSMALMEAMRERFERNEQIVLFLNRRGYSSFVLCRDCGTVLGCPNCDISLTYHRATEKCKCHYCGHEERVPHTCPQCESEHIRFFGTGTQKVEEEIYKLFPEAKVLRMDVDTTRQKGAHEQLLDAFATNEFNILLGTQMIAKGLDFPNITLVGVLSADTSLHLPDYRSAERTFQLLTQVSGRAGRHEKQGEVIVQTYTPEHYAIELSKDQLYEPFYEQEMHNRRLAGYPPYYYLALVQVTHEDVMMAAEYSGKVATYLRENLSFNVSIVGPTTASITRLQNRYRYQCLIKYRIEPNLIPVLLNLIKIYRSEWIKKGITLSIDLDPTMM
jgi:primosomal protein N' (replication factor Y) (superfamily II helicase)